MAQQSLRAFFRQVTRKGDPIDPRTLDATELAGLLHGSPSLVARIEEHMRKHGELWELDPAELMLELARLPGVGQATAAWWVLNELQIGRRMSAASTPPTTGNGAVAAH